MVTAPQLDFDAMRHLYLADGEPVPSVTQVIASVKISDISSIPAHNLEHARWVGEQTHLACHFLDEGDLDWGTLPDEVILRVEAWERFKQEKQFLPQQIECRSIAQSANLRYGMTIDRFGLLGDEPFVLDIKTAYRPQPEWQIQTAGYILGFRYPYIENRGVVHLKKDGSYSFILHEDSNDFDIFRAALEVTWWKLRHGWKLEKL